MKMKYCKQFKFCPHCSAELKPKNEGLLVCSKCGLHSYINPRPSTAAILENGKREIALVKRSFDPFKGRWDLPGGFVDLEESVEESMEREIKEEIGIGLDNLHYFNSYIDDYIFQGVRLPIIVCGFWGIVENSLKMKPGDDVSEVRFFPLEDVFEKAVFASSKKFIEEYLEGR